MAMQLVTSRRFQDWLVAAGVIPKDAAVRRVVIDANMNDPIKVYVELYGSRRMIEVVCPESLVGAKVEILS